MRKLYDKWITDESAINVLIGSNAECKTTKDITAINDSSRDETNSENYSLNDMFAEQESMGSSGHAGLAEIPLRRRMFPRYFTKRNDRFDYGS